MALMIWKEGSDKMRARRVELGRRGAMTSQVLH